MLPVSFSVMPGLDPGIHVVPRAPNDVDGRDKPGHDDGETDERKSPIVELDGRCKSEKMPAPLSLFLHPGANSARQR
ncbi:hypothetical protein BRAO375_1060003 [Bradyrhizobium sp. ORS 375]|nr:hypothetical protein BRAO375_1060003 [Bradyrhizobium sp. ORS 375]